MRTQESRENYLEAILILTQEKGFVRSIDVANFLGFSKPSVSVAMANLRNALLIYVDEIGGIHLTDAGQALAEQVYEKHQVISRILIALGVDEETAVEDACRIEHVISQLSFEKVKEHASNILMELDGK